MSIKTDSEIIRDETGINKNTATRVGGVLVDMATGLELLQDNQYSGVIVYETLLELPATGVINTSYKVTNDDVLSSNNGYYHWSGSAYVKDADLANGLVESGNTDAVSGGTVYDAETERFLERGKNKIEFDVIYEDSYLNSSDGALVEGVGSNYVFAYQPVKSDTRYVVGHTTKTVFSRIHFFDSNKVWIGSSSTFVSPTVISLNGKFYFTTMANCVFTSFEFAQSGLTLQELKDGVQLEINGVPTVYETPKDVIQEEKILVPKTTTPQDNYYDISMLSADEWIDQAGTIRSTLSLGLTRIPVEPSTTYCFRHSDDFYTFGSETALFYFDANGVKIGGNVNIFTLPNASGLGGKVLTTPSNCAYFFKNNILTGHDYSLDFTLQKGTVTSAYTDYIAEVDSLLGKPLKDNFARAEIDNLNLLDAELTKVKGAEYKNETLTQIYNSLDAIRSDAVTLVNNQDLALPNQLTLGSSFVLLKSYTSDAVISNIQIEVGSTTPLGTHTIYTYVIDSNDIILQKFGSVDIEVTTGVFIYDITVSDFILPQNTYIAFSLSDDIRAKYGSVVGATNNFKFYGLEPNEDKLIGDDFFALGSSTRSDAISIGWTATEKVFNTVLNSNYLSGLKICGIGDSMVEEYNGYSTVKSIGLRNAMNVTNLGISGNRITDTGGTGVAMCNRVNDIPLDTQILMVDCGTNDALQSITIGLESSTNILEFNGALNKFLDDTLTRIPTAGIVWVGLRQGGAESYYDAIVVQCEKRQIPILNSYKLGGIYQANTAQYNALTRLDNIHLSELGIERRSHQVEGFIRANIGGFAVV